MIMTYTKLSPEEIRTAVCEEAKKQFLKRGIAQTEMKQLAQTVGIGRTTLYRYFPSMDSLVFLVAVELLQEMVAVEERTEMLLGLNGYDSLVSYYDQAIDNFITHPDIMKFCMQFDMMYATGYPDLPEARQYSVFLKKLYDFESSLVCKGQMDGTIRKDVEPFMVLSGIGHSLFGYAQRTVSHQESSEQKRNTMRWIAHSLLETIRPSSV